MELKNFYLFSFVLVILASLHHQTNAVAVGGNSGLNLTMPLTTPEPPIQASTCPDNSTISPCTCSTNTNGLDITCSDSAIYNQEPIETTFRAIRQVNGIPLDRGVQIYRFTLKFTGLTQLDLAPFYASQIQVLYISDNYYLTAFLSSGQPQDYGSINATEFSLMYNSITRQGFGDTLKYFSSDMGAFKVYRLLNDDKNKNTAGNDNVNDDEPGSDSELELLPGISALTNLGYLGLTWFNIAGRLSSESWNSNSNSSGLQRRKLHTIYLDYDNITEIGENVFYTDNEYNYLYLDLQGNQLNETSFHPESGIVQTGRRTRLYLGGNQITTLPTYIFEAFLEAHGENYLDLGQNPLVCDERLSWLKSRRAELEGRVDGAYCKNDPGHTVFDSDLIP